MKSKKNVVILGSTGSIGVSALDVIRRMKGHVRVVGLAANRNVQRMREQILEFSPRYVSLDHAPSADLLKKSLARMKRAPIFMNSATSLENLVSLKNVDLILSGVVGFRGLRPLIAALKAGKTVGLANKEALIVAGELIMALSKKHHAPIIPVDSEHSAIFHCLKGQHHGDIEQIILTASGGPFYRSSRDLDTITVKEALKHPTWKMGEKITIDSATLMNKGLEAIEAHHLFQVPMNKISIVIHPQSIVHSLVEFSDGATLAQLSHPDMRIPIQYAITHPQRLKTPVKRLKLEDVGTLEFAKPDFSKFPCLGLALKAGALGGSAPAALSAANEEAVSAFLNGHLSFMGIARIVAGVMKVHRNHKRPTLGQIFDVDALARQTARQLIQKENKEGTL